MNKKWVRRRKRLFEIIEVGNDFDYVSRIYDFVNAGSIILNLIISILYTFSDIREQYGSWLQIIEGITVVFFTIDYVCRLVTARFLYPKLKEAQ